MTRRPYALTVLILLATAALAGAQTGGSTTPAPKPPAAAPTAQPPAPRRPNIIGGVPDTGQFLPDTAVLARVENRTIRVWDFRENYFNSYAQTRPPGTEAGRREFLDNMINKEVLALTALEINRPLDFEDRAVLREHTERALSNVVFQRLVRDSARVSEEELQHAWKQHHRMRRLQHIQFGSGDMALAHKVRRDLLAKRMSWSQAVKKHSIAKNDSGPDGTWGWMYRDKVPHPVALPVWDLPLHAISEPLRDIDGIHLVRAVDEQPVPMIAYVIARTLLLGQLQPWALNRRMEVLRERIREQTAMRYDTANILWASGLFGETAGMKQDEQGGTVLDVHGHLPEFAPQDTARVLATWNGGRFTLGRFLAAFNQIAPVQRTNVNTFEDFRGMLDNFVMEHFLAKMAEEHGLDKDPLAVALIAKKREQLLVEHLFEDSVEARVYVRPEQRRAYYERHLPEFHSYRNVRFAAIVRPTRAGADSVVARLAAGERPEAILAADSAAGFVSGSIRSIREDDRGTPYYRVLFEELRQGETHVGGPDKAGDYLVLHSIEYDQGRQLAYEEVQHLVDESLHNMTAEQLLKDLLARHRPRYRITSHPELLMRVKLADPLLD